MGKTLATLFGRTSKFITLLHDSITRTAFLRNRHDSLLLFSTSDVVDLLKLGQNRQAALRVIILNLFIRLVFSANPVVFQFGDCPEELKEGISSMIYASSRIGEFPELAHIRDYFDSKFGKDFVSQITEFPLYSSVNAKIVQNLSTRKPNLETRVSYLREIASENGITLNLDVDFQQGKENEKSSKLTRNTMTINQVLTSG
ncbi:hypothetical protein KSS87_023917, partial [Heliosperma pusillum]